MPRGADSNEIITVKLKRKICYRGHAHYQAVRPEYIQAGLQFLKLNNPFYNDVILSIENIPADIRVEFDEGEVDLGVDDDNDSETDMEEKENSLDEICYLLLRRIICEREEQEKND